MLANTSRIYTLIIKLVNFFYPFQIAFKRHLNKISESVSKYKESIQLKKKQLFKNYEDKNNLYVLNANDTKLIPVTESEPESSFSSLIHTDPKRKLVAHIDIEEDTGEVLSKSYNTSKLSKSLNKPSNFLSSFSKKRKLK